MRADPLSPPSPASIPRSRRRRAPGRLRARDAAPAPDLPAPLGAALGPPRLRAGLVARERLVRRLTEARDVPLALLVAPAGYGKTTLLAQWSRADPRPFAWLTLGARDDEPVRLRDAIASRLHALGAPGRATVLVLDDVQVLRARASFELLSAIAGQLGLGSALALASRTEPALPVGRLRAEDRIVELRADELAMTEPEGALLLRRAGLKLDATACADLVQRTEGWPAALRLAAGSLRAQADAGGEPERFAGDDRFVADYLRDELLSDLGPDALAFLTRTSALEQLSGPLCDAVLETSGSGRMLRELARSNLPLTALDRAEEQFRCHPLLAELLRAELRRAEPAREAETHRRASAWHEGRGDAEHALDHALAAGDLDRAGALLWRLAPAHVGCGRRTTVARRLERLGDEQIAAQPELALSAAATQLVGGGRDAVERLSAAAERALEDAAPERRSSLAAGAALMRAAVGRRGLQRMAQDAARAGELDLDDGPWRSFACLLEGTARQLLGERDRARRCLEEGVRLSGPGRRAAPLVEALCLAQLALLALEQEDWEHGAALAERARERVAGAPLCEDPSCALVFAVAAFVYAHRGPADAARRDAASARRLLAALADAVPAYDAQVRIVLARAELRLSDAARARALLAEASRMLRREPSAVVLRRWMDDAWARADAFAAGAVHGPSTLTTAELRVLRFLPSHFSFREIAARLHVSANTVKTQAHAVYRKLDVCSRSDAVARARAVGLVDG
jgi:LuxR family maltose regulon positive regulatory protein